MPVNIHLVPPVSKVSAYAGWMTCEEIPNTNLVIYRLGVIRRPKPDSIGFAFRLASVWRSFDKWCYEKDGLADPSGWEVILWHDNSSPPLIDDLYTVLEGSSYVDSPLDFDGPAFLCELEDQIAGYGKY